MKPIAIWAACAICLPTAAAVAQETTQEKVTVTTTEVRHDPTEEELWFFRPCEWSIDFFGTAAIPKSTMGHLSCDRLSDTTRLGLGVGGNYFFTRHLGISAEAYSENPGHSFVDDVSANLTWRFPHERAHIAPYVLGGAGYQFDPDDRWLLQAGAGIEVRFTRSVGMFADGRYCWVNDAPDRVLFRLGVRFAF
jgi:hypothetical protein